MAKFGYVGNIPGQSPVIVAKQSYTCSYTVGIVTFNSGYTPGYIDVYLNGVRLLETTDYSAADGRTVSLASSAADGDTIEMVAYKAYDLSTTAIGIASAGETIKADSVTTLNFVGTGNTFKVNGTTVDVSISGGGGGSVGISSNSLSSFVGTGVTHLNFVGTAVTAVGAGTTMNITVNKTFSILQRTGLADMNVTSGIATIQLRSGVGTITF